MGYPPVKGRLHTRYAPVRYSHKYCYLIPFNLHVLGLPLALILSQDQTLHCIFYFCFVVVLLFRKRFTSLSACYFLHFFKELLCWLTAFGYPSIYFISGKLKTNNPFSYAASFFRMSCVCFSLSRLSNLLFFVWPSSSVQPKLFGFRYSRTFPIPFFFFGPSRSTSLLSLS